MINVRKYVHGTLYNNKQRNLPNTTCELSFILKNLTLNRDIEPVGKEFSVLQILAVAIGGKGEQNRNLNHRLTELWNKAGFFEHLASSQVPFRTVLSSVLNQT